MGRVKTYEAIVKGENVPEPGVPESFKVLIKELQSIGLDIKVLNEDEEEISMRDSDDDVTETARDLDLNIDGEIPLLLLLKQMNILLMKIALKMRNLI